jgi:hypothetical protein
MRVLNNEAFVIFSPFVSGTIRVPIEGEIVKMCKCVICAPSSTIASGKNVVVLCRECTINFLIAERAALRAKKEMLAQCCECGLILNGSFKGLTFLQENNQPNKEAGESHGLCNPCRDRKWLDFKEKKAARKKIS